MKVKIYKSNAHISTLVYLKTQMNLMPYHNTNQSTFKKKTNYTTIVVKQSNLSVAKKEREKATFKYLQ